VYLNQATRRHIPEERNILNHCDEILKPEHHIQDTDWPLSTHSKFRQNRTTVTGTLHEEAYIDVCAHPERNTLNIRCTKLRFKQT
jgi:hypothetical protein